MNYKSILLFALFLFVPLGFIPVIAQDLNKWEERQRIVGQEEMRHFIFDDMDIPITKPRHPSLPANEITTLQPIIPDFQVNDDEGSAGQYSPAISTDGNGNFVITWFDYRNGDWDIYAQRYSSDGTALGNNFKVNDEEESAFLHVPPSISMDSSGNFVIAWSDDRNGDSDIYLQRYLSDGTAEGSNFKVNDDEGSAGQVFPSIEADGSGNFVIAWQDSRNGDYDIYAQRYLSDGTAIESNFKANDDEGSAYQRYPSISTDGSGNFVITWVDVRNGDGDIYIQRYLSDGTAVGSNIKVNDDEESADYQSYPSISMNGSGNFAITWTDIRNGYPYDIYAQRYSSDGTAEGSNFKVNDDEGNAGQRYPSISKDESGNFVITWHERNGDPDIYAQRYSSDGTPLGTNFRVTNTGDGTQLYPDVKLWNNRIYNTWQDNRVEGTGSDIWANVLDWENPVAIIDVEAVPSAFILGQNYPNPFNPQTTIRYQLSMTGNVQLTIYNTLGQKVRMLVNKQQTPGNYIVQWDSRNDQNKEMPSGIYIYRITTPNGTLVRKMVLVR